MTEPNIDPNYAIRYHVVKFKRSYRDQVKPHTLELWGALVNVVNAAAKTILGFLGTVFGTLADICLKYQAKWK